MVQAPDRCARHQHSHTIGPPPGMRHSRGFQRSVFQLRTSRLRPDRTIANELGFDISAFAKSGYFTAPRHLILRLQAQFKCIITHLYH